MLRTPHRLARLVTTLYLRVPILPLFKIARNNCFLFSFWLQTALIETNRLEKSRVIAVTWVKVLLVFCYNHLYR